jgi:hypothetical protein
VQLLQGLGPGTVLIKGIFLWQRGNHLSDVPVEIRDQLGQLLGRVMDTEAVESLVEYFRSISGEHPDWDEYRQAMVRQGKSLLRVTPARWGPVATGGFPPRLAPPG